MDLFLLANAREQSADGDNTVKGAGGFVDRFGDREVNVTRR